MQKDKTYLALLLTGLLTGCGLDSGSGENNDIQSKSQSDPIGRWIYGDMHVHSTASDGHNLMTTVLDKAFNDYGASYITSTDHSGFNAYKINDALVRTTVDGQLILNPAPEEEVHSHDYAKENYPDDKAEVERSELINTLYGHVNQYRQRLNTSQYLLQGMEWTIPYTKEHATLLILDDGNLDSLAAFHQQYAKGNGNSKELEDNLNAVKELEHNHNGKAIFAFNHPSRSHKVKIEDIRQFHNAAPTAFIGMEGAPGHQRNEESRGSYDETDPIIMDEYQDYGIAYFGQTYGGFDYMTARLGGVWDALLSEGRHFSIISQSDFHSQTKDFWPNQYAKTHMLLETESREGVINALKKGNIFVTHGDLISALTFNVSSHDAAATMGETLAVPLGDNIKVSIEITQSELNHNGDTPQLAFVDVIVGEVTAYKDEQDSDFNKPFSDSTRILASFSEGDEGWNIQDGKIRIEMSLPQDHGDMYIRLRGSNNAKGTPGYVDEQGNPIIDLEKQEPSVEAMAWKDLWFYSNAIFISTQ